MTGYIPVFGPSAFYHIRSYIWINMFSELHEEVWDFNRKNEWKTRRKYGSRAPDITNARHTTFLFVHNARQTQSDITQALKRLSWKYGIGGLHHRSCQFWRRSDLEHNANLRSKPYFRNGEAFEPSKIVSSVDAIDKKQVLSIKFASFFSRNSFVLRRHPSQWNKHTPTLQLKIRRIFPASYFCFGLICTKCIQLPDILE